jgi:superfamily II DNA or RNA helicase
VKLRDYEARAVHVVPGLLTAKRRVVLVGPTGSGKTVVAAHVMLEMRGKRVLWLAHRWELIDQARNQLIASGVAESSIRVFTGTEKSGDDDAWITVASVDMFHRHEVPPFDLAVVDEAHRTVAASYQKILASNPKAMVLGLTATPWRLDGKGLGDVYAHLHVMAGPTELIVDGHIAQPRTYGIPKMKAREIVRGLASARGDFCTAPLAAAMMKRKLMGDVVEETARLAPGAPTLVFAVNREHGKALAIRFHRSGRKTAYLDGETPKGEREKTLTDLESGAIEVVVNVDVLSEGFDCPPVKCIALARPTKSLTRFLQQVGRASRPFNGKKPVILDHAGNCWRFGLPESEREWSLEDEERGGGDPPMRRCEACGAMNTVASRECVECGAALPLTEREEAEMEEERVRLQRVKVLEKEKAAARKRIEKIAREKKAPDGWAEKVLAKMFEAA